MLDLESRDPGVQIRPLGTRQRFLGKGKAPLPTWRAELGGLGPLLQLLERELSDRLEHREPRLFVPACICTNEALVDQGLERVEIRGADPFRGIQRAATGEDSQTSEEGSFTVVQQITAPLDRRAERALALGRVRGACGESGSR